MTEKDTTIHIKRLIQDVSYYNNVFKKTEKIASVVLYTLGFKKDEIKDSLLLQKIETQSIKVHEVSLSTLQSFETSDSALTRLQQELVSLSSLLSIAGTASLLPADIMQVIKEQIDVVIRHLTNHHLAESGVVIDDLHEQSIPTESSTATQPAQKAPRHAQSSEPRPTRAKRVTVPAGDISSDAYLVYSQLTDRAERIKTVLEAKPQATVKDVAEIITDVSEKTIQRELNSLIEKGQVVREGERRWSKYSVVKE